MSIARVKASSLTQGLPKRKTILAGNDTILPGVYESIQTVNVTAAGGQATVSFTSIPSTYTHLQVRSLTKFAANSFGNIRFNGDTTSSNYRNHALYGNGATASAGTAATAAYYPYEGNTQWGGYILDILDYSNTNKYTTTRELGGYDNNGSGFIGLSSNLWMNTAAINQIVLTTGSTFQQYSSFALYGIK